MVQQDDGPPRSRATISVAIPPGWHYKESLTLYHPSREANLIASSEPVEDDLDSKTYAQEQGPAFRDAFPGYREIAPLEPFDIGGLDEHGWLREFGWTPEGTDAEPVRQIQVYATRAGRGYTATATVGLKHYERHRLTLYELLRSIVIDTLASDSIPTVGDGAGAPNRL